MKIRHDILALVAFATMIGASVMMTDLLSEQPSHVDSEIDIGEVAPAGGTHLITRPGRYGLGPEVPGSQYAVVGGMLVRLDPHTLQIQSVIRMVNGLLD